MEVENRKEIKKEEEESSPSDVVRWGRFLPGMVLRILLVEADDSTRQIIAALLRKCSYRVAAVSDGLKAWEALQRRPHSIDLILTEVELPSISGYALLTLIMEHDICKNIPVIMMSSQDSISVVLKCMSKGAADFLIKPVRKNELRNLWQHVWRRQTQTAGLVPDNTAIEQQKGEDVTSENNAASNHSSDYINSSPKYKECCEKGSDAQSSCTTPYVEAESAFMKIVQGSSQPNGGNGSEFSNTKTHGECRKLVMNSVIPKSEIGVNSTEVEPESASCNVLLSTASDLGNDRVCAVTTTSDSDLGLESHRCHANTVQDLEVHCNGDDVGDPSSGALDLIGRFEQHSKDIFNLSAINDTNKFSCAPELELSLIRIHHTYQNNEATDEGHMLSHSNTSAFTRYNNVKASGRNFHTWTSNCSEVKQGAITLHGEHPTEITFGTQSHDAALSSQGDASTLFTGQSGQSEAVFSVPDFGFIAIPAMEFDSLCAGYGQRFPPTFDKQSGFLPLLSPNDHRKLSPYLMSSPLLSSSEINNSGLDECVSAETINLSSCQFVQKEDKTMNTVRVLRFGSPTPALNGNGSLRNGNASTFNTGASENTCHGTDGNTTPAAAAVITSISECVKDGRLFIPDGLKEEDSHYSSQREAALAKFRLKRKERCFDKKVRYQSRKRLAEQRPRVKGQFVRHVQTDLPPPGESY